MSHITIIINRGPPPTSEETDEVVAEVHYQVPHNATEQQVGQAVRRLYRQVKNLGEEQDDE